MYIKYLLFKNNTEPYIAFYLNFRTVKYDEPGDLRDFEVKISAETNIERPMEIRSENFGNLYIAGRTFMLPRAFTLDPLRENIILNERITDCPNSRFSSKLDFRVTLNYVNSSLGLLPENIKGELIPEPICKDFSVEVSPKNVILGENITVNSDIFSKGYQIKCNVFVKNHHVGTYVLSKDNFVFKTDKNYIFDIADSDSAVINLDFSAFLGETRMGIDLNKTVNGILAKNDGLPEAIFKITPETNSPELQKTGLILKNRSKVKIEITDVRPFGHAEISVSYIEIEGQRYNFPVALTDYFQTPGERNYKIYLRDTRQKERIYSGKFNVEDYGAPIVSTDVKRCDANGNETLIGNYLKLTCIPEKLYTLYGANSYIYKYRYKKSEDLNYNDFVTFRAGESVIVNANLDKTAMYEVGIRITDIADTTVYKYFVLEPERIELHIAKNRIGIGKIGEKPFTLDSAFDICTDKDFILSYKDGKTSGLRSIAEKSNLNDGLKSFGYKLVEAYSNGDISNTVNNVYNIVGNDCCAMIILSVMTDGLSLPRGLHLYFVQNTENRSVCRKL